MQRILSNPEILAKLQKGLEQMSTSLRTLSKICGLLMQPGAEFPDPTQSDQPASSDSDESSSEPLPPALKWDKEITNWLFSKECRWGPKHAKHVAEYAIGKKWRADSLGHVWMYTGPSHGLEPVQVENRQNWRKTTMCKLEELYDKYCDELENAKEYLIHNKAKDTGWWREVRCTRQRRLHNVIKAKPIRLKDFIKIMQELHCELAPLRGRKNN